MNLFPSKWIRRKQIAGLLKPCIDSTLIDTDRVDEVYALLHEYNTDVVDVILSMLEKKNRRHEVVSEYLLVNLLRLVRDFSNESHQLKIAQMLLWKEVLNSADVRVRMRIVDALCRIGGEGVVPFLEAHERDISRLSFSQEDPNHEQKERGRTTSIWQIRDTILACKQRK